MCIIMFAYTHHGATKTSPKGPLGKLAPSGPKGPFSRNGPFGVLWAPKKTVHGPLRKGGGGVFGLDWSIASFP